MQAVLVFIAVHVAAAQDNHLSVVPPQESADDENGKICKDDLYPVVRSPDFEGRNALEPFLLILAGVLGPIDGNDNGTAQDSQNEKYIAAHYRETEEDGSVQTGMRDNVLLACRPQRFHPRKDTLANRRRRMFLVGVFQFGCVYDGVVRAYKGKENGHSERNAH